MPSMANRQIVLCPECDEPMVLRNGARGSFWGCGAFPRCRGVRKVGEETKVVAKTVSKYAPIVKSSGTHEQEAIWDFLLRKSAHVVVNAGPGTGKTWSAVQYCLRAPSSLRILFTAFNKHIAKEAQGKFFASKIGNAEVKTSHSWGNGVIRSSFKSLGAPNENKMQEILEQLHPAPLTGRGEW
ncbi:MAG: topoisomerase DNA-binding C4 zinc finger domain-containing protein, partial [Candidatus Eremiobacteraeota bacterium]|nr:topoisomerase DNA-binding C4 zinc finger domain-containing protein [Candidatus Eremiobacteraeota bacterium]